MCDGMNDAAVCQINASSKEKKSQRMCLGKGHFCVHRGERAFFFKLMKINSNQERACRLMLDPRRGDGQGAPAGKVWSVTNLPGDLFTVVTEMIRRVEKERQQHFKRKNSCQGRLKKKEKNLSEKRVREKYSQLFERQKK